MRYNISFTDEEGQIVQTAMSVLMMHTKDGSELQERVRTLKDRLFDSWTEDLEDDDEA